MFLSVFSMEPEFISKIDIDILSTYIMFFFASIVLSFLVQRDENWFRLEVLFLLGFGIVHFQWIIMIALSGISISSFEYISEESSIYINYGAWLSTIGILAWFMGYSWKKTQPKNKRIEYYINNDILFWISTLLFILFILTAGSNFLSGGVYKGEGGSSVGEGNSVYLQLMFSISILVLSTATILKNKPKSKVLKWLLTLDKKYIILAGAYILVFTLAGDRGAGLQVGMTFLIIFGSIIKPIKLKSFIIIVIFGALISTLIGLSRSSGSGVLSSSVSNLNFSSNYDATLVLANSARTLHIALANVPTEHDYFMGGLWSGNLLAVIPMAQSTYLKFTESEDYELASSGYITFLVFGSNPPSGEGTSLIADIYLNFGAIGTIFFMYLLGRFIKKLQNELNLRKNFYWIITAGIMASTVFYMGRGGIFEAVRPILWGLLLAVIFIKTRKVIQ